MFQLANNKTERPKLIALVITILVLGFLLVIWLQAGRWYRAQLLSERQAQVVAELIPYANALTSTIDRRFSLLRGLQAFTEANLPHELTASEFEKFTAGLYANTNGIRNFSVAPAGVQRYVYPLAGNENVLNHDLVHDERANVRVDVQRAIQSRQIVLSGPYELRQEGLGLIARLAVYPENNSEFWGLVAMVLDIPPLLEEAGLEPGPLELDFALRDESGQLFYGQSTVFDNAPIIYPIKLPDGTWELGAIPRGGWNAVIQDRIFLFQGVGLVLVILLTALVYLVTNRQKRLELAVQARTREFFRANTELEKELLYRKQTEGILQQHAERLKILREIDQSILSAHSPRDVAQTTLCHVHRLIPCFRADVILFDETSGQATVLASEENNGGNFSEGMTFQLQDFGAILATLCHGKVNSQAELTAHSISCAVDQILWEEGVRSYINVPLLVKEQLIGTLNLEASSPQFFTADFIDIAGEVANPLAVAITQARLQEKVRQHTKNLEQLVTDRTQELSLLYSVAAVASKSLDFKTTLTQSLDQVLTALKSKNGAIHLLNQRDGSLETVVERGIFSAAVGEIPGAPSPDNLAHQIIKSEQPLIISADSPYIYVGMPLKARGGPVGVISLLREAANPLNTDEITLLTSIAEQIGAIVESARLRQLAEQAVITEERARLARDLHDSVTQLLYSMALITKAGHESYRNSNLSQMDKYLTEIGDITHQALKEMRLLVYGLRPPALEQDGLAGALQLRLETVEGRVGVKTNLLVDDIIDLPGQVEEALFYIANEALNNALKHAAPTSVSVCIKMNSSTVDLTVKDDGCGFNPDAVRDKGGMGLISIRERVHKLGGEVSIQSAKNEGTTITVHVNFDKVGER